MVATQARLPSRRFKASVVERVPMPQTKGGVLNLDLIVLDVQVHRLVGLAFDDDGIVTGQLDAGADHAAAVCVDDQMVLGERGQEADGGTASQRHAGSGQRTDGVNDLGLLGKRVGASGHLVVHDLVSKAHAADVFLIRCGGLGGDAAVVRLTRRILPAQPYDFSSAMLHLQISSRYMRCVTCRAIRVQTTIRHWAVSRTL